MLNNIASKALMGIRKYSGTAKKLFGHSNNAIKILGSTTNVATKMGFKNTPLHKANNFAQRLQPTLGTIESGIDRVNSYIN